VHPYYAPNKTTFSVQTFDINNAKKLHYYSLVICSFSYIEERQH